MQSSCLSLLLFLKLQSNVLVYASWVKLRGRVDEGTFHTVNVAVFEQCCELCHYTKSCLSVNWSPNLKECEFVNRKFGEESLRPSFFWTYASPPKEDLAKCPACDKGKLCVPVFNAIDLCVTHLPGNEVLQSSRTISVALETSFTDASAALSTTTVGVLSTHRNSQPYSKFTVPVHGDSSASTILEEQTTTSDTCTSLSTDFIGLGISENNLEGSVVDTQNSISSYKAINQPSSVLPSQVESTTISFAVSQVESLSSVSKTVSVESSSLMETTTDEITTTSSPTTSIGFTSTTDTSCSVFDYSRMRRNRKRHSANELRRMKIKFKCSHTPRHVPFQEEQSNCPSGMIRRDGCQCGCKNGLHFSPSRNTCTKKCSKYGAGFMLQSYVYCIMGHNDKEFSSNDVEECKQECLKTKKFVCRSFDYWKGKCYLSKDTRADVRGDWQTFCDCIYYQRNCDG